MKEEERMRDKASFTEMLELTTEIVAAHVGNNPLPAPELPSLIQDVYGRLSRWVRFSPFGGLKPAVPVKRSRIPRLHRLSGGREETENAEEASENRLQYDARGISGTLGSCRPNTRWWRRITRSTAAIWRKRSASAQPVASQGGKSP